MDDITSTDNTESIENNDAPEEQMIPISAYMEEVSARSTTEKRLVRALVIAILMIVLTNFMWMLFYFKTDKIHISVSATDGGSAQYAGGENSIQHDGDKTNGKQ